MALFECEGSYLYKLDYKGNEYDSMIDADFHFGEKELIDATQTKLHDIELEEGDTAELTYDFGDGWEFDIVCTKKLRPERVAGRSYPKFIDGAGKGIMKFSEKFNKN